MAHFPVDPVVEFMVSELHSDMNYLRRQGRVILDTAMDWEITDLIDGKTDTITDDGVEGVSLIMLNGNLMTKNVCNGRLAWMCKTKGCENVPAGGQIKCKACASVQVISSYSSSNAVTSTTTKKNSSKISMPAPKQVPVAGPSSAIKITRPRPASLSLPKLTALTVVPKKKGSEGINVFTLIDKSRKEVAQSDVTGPVFLREKHDDRRDHDILD